MYSYDRRTASGVTAALDMGLARAFADAWSSALIAEHGPKHIEPAKLGELLRSHWVNEVAMNIRNLEYRCGTWMAPEDLVAQMRLVCPQYNQFHIGLVGKWLGLFPGVEAQPAREHSVAIYLKGDPNMLSKAAHEAKAAVHADTVDFQDDGTLRLWWD